MPRRRIALVVLSFLGFASLGLPDGVLGVAWPSMRREFGLPLDGLGALLVSTTLGYVTPSFLAGALLARVSVGALLALSCLATGATLLGYAAAPLWAVVVALGVLAGLGAGAIDAGINTFAATNFEPRMLHLLHAAYGVGTTAGPVWMTSVLTGGHAWQRGYLAIAAVQLLLAAGFAATPRLWPGPLRREAKSATPAAPLAETLRLPTAQLGAAAFLLYLGVEATTGVWLFSLLEDGRGGLLIGRIGFGFAPNSLRPAGLLPPCIAGLVAFAALLALDLGPTASFVAAAGLGVSAAPIFPALIGATPERLGPAHTANTVGLQVAAAALGQSSVPALAGLMADHSGLEWVPRTIFGLALALLAVSTLLARTTSQPGPVAGTQVTST